MRMCEDLPIPHPKRRRFESYSSPLCLLNVEGSISSTDTDEKSLQVGEETPKQVEAQPLQNGTGENGRTEGGITGSEKDEKGLKLIEGAPLGITEQSLDPLAENPLKPLSLPFPEHIRPKLFDSQVEGVEFLWREVVRNGGGALLAHTMGMGKTLQIITLLQIISTAQKSGNEAFAQLLPENLKGRHKVMIVAPPGLLRNWKQEFIKWIPENSDEHLLRFFLPGETKSVEERTDMLRTWRQEGGVLMLGYHYFREYAMGSRTVEMKMESLGKLKRGRRNKRGNATAKERAARASRSKTPSSQDTANSIYHEEQLEAKVSEELADIVLSTPTIVIADEAHVVKNEESMLSIALRMINTQSRIALTGSPLANNLNEYYALTNWTSKGLLRSKGFFSSFFIKPIEAGLFEDSSPPSKALSVRRLALLRHVMAAKMHRCGIERIRHRLPEKREFILTVELTSVQRKIYSLFTKSVIEDIEGELGSEKSGDKAAIQGFFDHVKCLRVLLNHPMILYDLFKKRATQNAKKTGVKNFSLSEMTVVSLIQLDGND
ncbi:hypothetical protein ABW19_dt0210145 [Dactylella cylindrospora]|nr:hypothetical protein ABW19_dt0210145 [Dactylella cylindrospora]